MDDTFITYVKCFFSLFAYVNDTFLPNVKCFFSLFVYVNDTFISYVKCFFSLFTYVNETLDFSIPTYATLIKVLDNYNHVVGISEHSNSHETSEINAFLNALSQTTVIKKAHEFLHTKGG